MPRSLRKNWKIADPGKLNGSDLIHMHVRVEDICKAYNGRVVIEDVSFDARAGFILGVLGPENAGKTTALRMLLNIVKPDTGLISYDDMPLSARIRDAIGYLPEERGLYQNDPLNKMLIHFARLKNLSRKKASVEAVRLMDRFNIIDKMDVPVLDLSPDVQQKVQMMCAIIHNPDLIILDEPFKGLSPNNVELMGKLLQRFKDEGKTVVLATSQLDEAEKICDQVLLLNNGRIVLQDNISKIHKKFQENLIKVQADDDLSSLKSIYGVKKFVQENQTARLYIDTKIPPQKILDVIIKSVNVSRVEVNRPTLNDIFLQLVNGQSKEL